jgi:hypothetical protein
MVKHYFDQNGLHLGSVSVGNLTFDQPNIITIEADEIHTYPIRLQYGVIVRDDIDELSAAKAAALKKIEASADEYQQRFLGANSPQREARFAQNLAAAKRVVADNGTPEDLQSMALQAQAKAAETGENPKSALEFAQWIAAWEGKTTLIAGAIEAFLVQSRSGLNALTELAQIEPYLSQIVAQAEAKFAELAG